MSERKLTLYSFVYRGASSALTFLNSAIAARYLPTASRGEFQLSTTIATLGQSFSGGYTNYFSYALPRRPDDKARIVQMGNLVMYAFSVLVWIAAALVAWLCHPSLTVTFALFGMPLTFLFGYSSKLLNSLGEISWLNRANIAQAVVFLVCYLVFIGFQPHLKDSLRLLWTFRIWLLSWIVCVVMTLFVAYRALGFRDVLKWRWSSVEWRGLYSYGTASSLAIVTGYVNYRTDFWMLLTTHSATIISIYGVAVAAAEILNTLTQTISTMVFHRVTAATTDDAGAITERAARQTLITSTLGAIVLAVGMPVLVAIYSWSKYGHAIGPFYVLLPGLVLKATANVISQYFTNAQGKPLTLMWVNLCVIGANALICLGLIPLLGMYGASIASTISYIFELALYVSWYHRTAKRDSRALWQLRREDFAPYRDIARALRRRVLRRA
ncbi:polysaccharide biosynthesis protein [Alicyclobacillus hesperidum]|uniref:Membrane protein involved in the export of O-antigen and teichoic acid n=1 Tax=Alicyclobacillus hesperidum TaxID=89784 RepID=A0A1H2V8T6_9BACL|nr:polysaccharide biosynthesis C-terminal domain-containing protein [Alicyclobacillus hesperidum]GLV14885.1 polysaccharide biosynthesis protein [Alicyclobacillus hesperidum]SDW64314.1 Membrane protein involved in the export of O-antigen and teichoic acid [Alicyclobacillus hesperidum]